jgi:transcriptional regulator with XRE-family HTH domain
MIESKKPAFYKEIGHQINHLRTQRGLTQERLAELAELSPTYISHIERGSKKVSLNALICLAAALEVPVERLLSQPRNEGHSIHASAVDELLADCSSREQQLLLNITAAVKLVLRNAA